jgi:hypothetical protein
LFKKSYEILKEFFTVVPRFQLKASLLTDRITPVSGGTREGKCKNGGPLTTKAAPDTPRHTPVKTTGKRDPRKRPRESPQHNQRPPPVNNDEGRDEPQRIKGAQHGVANGRLSLNGSIPTKEAESGKGKPATVPETGPEQAAESHETGPALKKKKGRPSAAEKAAADKVSARPEENSPQKAAELPGEVNTSKPEAKKGAAQAVSTGGEGLAPPFVPKRKGRPPRIKGAGKEEVRSEERSGGESPDVLRGGSEAQPLAGEAAKDSLQRTPESAVDDRNSASAVDGSSRGNHESAAATIPKEPVPSASALGEVGASAGTGAFAATPAAEIRGEAVSLPEEKQGEETKTPLGEAEVKTEPKVLRQVREALTGVQSGERGASEEESEGLPEAATEHETAESCPDQSSNRVPGDGGNAPDSKEDKGSEFAMKGDCRAEQVGGAEGPLSKGQGLEKVEVKLENFGREADRERAKQEGREVEKGPLGEKEGGEATGTPLSILDVEKDRAPRGAGTPGAGLPEADEALLEEMSDDAAREEKPKETPARPLELHRPAPVETAPSPDALSPKQPTVKAEEADAAPSSSQLDPEPVRTKALRKKARLAKALGPHELVTRPRRERPPPALPAFLPPVVAPRGIADAVKLRTAGAQAEKKNARQQVGERIYTSRLPPGFSVAAAIAAAAAAPPSPQPKIRGRPPKQKNGLGFSRLGGGKRAEEEAEERRAQLRKEEHEAAVRIFKEEEEERERLLKVCIPSWFVYILRLLQATSGWFGEMLQLCEE